jgi:hypothetical protein
LAGHFLGVAGKLQAVAESCKYFDKNLTEKFLNISQNKLSATICNSKPSAT